MQHCIRHDQDMLWTQAWQKFIAVSELEPWCIWSWLMRQVVAAMQSVYLCLILQYLKTAITIVYWVFTESITAPPTRLERAGAGRLVQQWPSCHLSPVHGPVLTQTLMFKCESSLMNLKNPHFWPVNFKFKIFQWSDFTNKNQGQFWNTLVLRIPKLFLVTRFDKDFTRILRVKEKTYIFESSNFIWSKM